MFEHLIDFEPQVLDSAKGFVPVEKTHPTEHVDAQTNTLDWLKELGAADEFEIATEAQTQAARTAFTNLVTAQPPNQTHKALEQIKTPAAVQHLVGMLTAYDWQFINQAQEIRGYAMAQLLEETKNPSASIRLKALALLGKVTEVGLFTEKIEVKKSEMTDAELEARIKEKLGKMAKIVDITDIREVQEIDCQPVDTDEDASEPHTES
jgi:HEAT repeat protein